MQSNLLVHGGALSKSSFALAPTLSQQPSSLNILDDSFNTMDGFVISWLIFICSGSKNMELSVDVGEI